MANTGKLIQKCFWNFSFPGCDIDGFLESFSSNWIPVFLWLLAYYFRTRYFFEISIFMSWTDFWNLCPYLDEFSRNRSSSCPGNLPIRANSVEGKWTVQLKMGAGNYWKEVSKWKISRRKCLVSKTWSSFDFVLVKIGY